MATGSDVTLWMLITSIVLLALLAYEDGEW